LKLKSAVESDLDLSSVVKPEQSVTNQSDLPNDPENVDVQEVSNNTEDETDQKFNNPAQGQLW
jgi:hypothetical protein